MTHSTRLRIEFEPIAICIYLCRQYSRKGISEGSDSRPISINSTCVCQMCDRISSTSRWISYFSHSMVLICTNDLLAHPFSWNSLSAIAIFLSRKNFQRACCMMGWVWAMTPSKSKRTARNGFILFHYYSSNTPLRPWFIECKSCCRKQPEASGIKSKNNTDNCQNRSSDASSFPDVTRTDRFPEIGNSVSQGPSKHVSKKYCEKWK